MNDDQFKIYVAETLGELKTGMKSLLGNGQPGRIGVLEREVEALKHSGLQATGRRTVLNTILIASGKALLAAISALGGAILGAHFHR